VSNHCADPDHGKPPLLLLTGPDTDVILMALFAQRRRLLDHRGLGELVQDLERLINVVGNHRSLLERWYEPHPSEPVDESPF
jgi:hypothetical protein